MKVHNVNVIVRTGRKSPMLPRRTTYFDTEWISPLHRKVSFFVRPIGYAFASDIKPKDCADTNIVTPRKLFAEFTSGIIDAEKSPPHFTIESIEAIASPAAYDAIINTASFGLKVGDMNRKWIEVPMTTLRFTTGTQAMTIKFGATVEGFVDVRYDKSFEPFRMTLALHGVVLSPL